MEASADLCLDPSPTFEILLESRSCMTLIVTNSFHPEALKSKMKPLTCTNLRSVV